MGDEALQAVREVAMRRLEHAADILDSVPTDCLTYNQRIVLSRAEDAARQLWDELRKLQELRVEK